MGQDAITLALARKAMLPDLYSRPVAPLSRRSGYPDYVADMILDLRSSVTGISNRQIGDALGIPESSIRKITKDSPSRCLPADEQPDDDEFVPMLSNEEMCANELATLRRHHLRYTEEPRAANEYPGCAVILSSPAFQDRHRRADQSHTLPRPITLPTKPFWPLLDRYAEHRELAA